MDSQELELRVGDRVSGVIDLYVDHFEYVEFLAKKRLMPPLIYRWTVEEVQLDITPTVLVDRGDPRYPRFGTRVSRRGR